MGYPINMDDLGVHLGNLQMNSDEYMDALGLNLFYELFGMNERYVEFGFRDLICLNCQILQNFMVDASDHLNLG
jgi:hypothetical protein